MKPSQLIETIHVAIEADQPLLIEGPPGVGKSKIVAKVVDDMQRKLIDQRFSDRDPVEVCGFYAVENGRTIRTMPSFIPVNREGKVDNETEYVLFCDEVTTAVPLMQAVLYQIVHDRKAGDHPLPQNCPIIAAGNRLADGAVVNRMSTALRSRFVTVELEPDAEEWCTWALLADIDPAVVAFMRFRPALLHSFDKNAKAFPCPRTWEFASKLLRMRPSPAVEMAMLEGAVGQGAAVEFAAFLKLFREVPDIATILANPDSVAVPRDPSGCYAVATALAYKATTANIDKVIKYTDRMSPEYRILCMKSALAKTPAIEKTKHFIQWAVRHQDALK